MTDVKRQDKTPDEADVKDMDIRNRLNEMMNEEGKKFKTAYAIFESTDGHVTTILEGPAPDLVLCEKLLQMHTNRVIVAAMQPVN